MIEILDVQHARTKFAALQKDSAPVFLDNAGGSQTLTSVVSTISQYLNETNVQLGATYHVSQQSTDRFNEGLRAAAEYMGADADEIAIGSSTTQLFTNLSLILPRFPNGAEVILSSIDHEANIAPWVRFATQLQPNLVIKWWTPSSLDEEQRIAESTNAFCNPIHTVESLRPLLTERTVFVSCTHTSNLLGSINDVQAIAAFLKESYGAGSAPGKVFKAPKPFLCIDAVAYAPHRRVDMHGMFPDVDFYCFSWYKVYGPHVAVLYASRRTQGEGNLGTLCHYFASENKSTAELDLTTRLALAGSSYELVAALPRIGEYITGLGGSTRTAQEQEQHQDHQQADEQRVKDAWDAIARHEEELSEVLLAYLREPDRQRQFGITIFGFPDADRRKRVPVISFGVAGRSSRSIVEGIERRTQGRLGCRWGHFYSKRLVDNVLHRGQEGSDGVVRVSAVHYNTVDEIRELVTVLDGVLHERMP